MVEQAAVMEAEVVEEVKEVEEVAGSWRLLQE
jgi:hypothetical protein